MNREEQILMNRLKELAGVAYQRGIPMFSDFLNLNEQNLFKTILKDMPPVSCFALGGYNLAERKVIGFFPQQPHYTEAIENLEQAKESRQYSYYMYTLQTPMDVLVIKPLNKKFAESLNHRDFLGTILGLGIERSKIGDIVLNDNAAYVFCIDKMSQFIIENMTRVKHTPVSCERGTFYQEAAVKYTELKGSVASIRLDSILAICFNSSRSSIISNIEEGRVFVNGKIITTNSYNLVENDIISARGFGKFQYIGTSAKSKKGKFIVTIHKYV